MPIELSIMKYLKLPPQNLHNYCCSSEHKFSLLNCHLLPLRILSKALKLPDFQTLFLTFTCSYNVCIYMQNLQWSQFYALYPLKLLLHVSFCTFSQFHIAYCKFPEFHTCILFFTLFYMSICNILVSSYIKSF